MIFVNGRCEQELAADTAAHMASEHPDYAILGGRIAISRLYRATPRRFSLYVKEHVPQSRSGTNLQSQTFMCGSLTCPMLDYGHRMFDKTFIENVANNASKLDAAIVHGRDSNFS